MNILIVEDNPIQLQSITAIVKKTISGCQIYTADCYEGAVAQLEAAVFQIFLLDIDLQQDEERDGVSLAEVIRKDPRYRIVPILFLTGVTSRMSAAVNQAHCYSYLLKPYEESDLVHALTSLLASPLLPAPVLEIRDPQGIYFHLSVPDILYAEIFGHTLMIYTIRETYQTKDYTISQLCAGIPEYLSQCHKSYAVNPSRIIGYRAADHMLLIENPQTAVPIGRSYRSGFQTWIQG